MRKFLRLLGISQSECIHCQSPAMGDLFLCKECIQDIKPFHPIEYTPIPYVFSYRVFGKYEGVLKSILQQIKFSNNPFLARWLGEAIKDHLWEFIEQTNPDIITFPELNLRRFWTRGFNQIEEILKGAGVPYQRVFKRVGFDPPMARLDKKKRIKASQTHTLREEWIEVLEGKKVLIVDDVLTTGGTISRLCELLLSVGAEQTHAFFLTKEF
ncbi:phosphoribosyltransferase family protein [Thermocrinis sp.]|uniref:ComF family protein n=1 Tax=Thermocrinis sp. TaxID=2024383 RepID=UPI002FDE5844